MVKEIQAIINFTIFAKNSKIQNGRHFWKEEKISKVGGVSRSSTLRVKNFDEIALSLTVKEIQAILSFTIFVKFRKFKMAAIFGKKKIFFQKWAECNAEVPCGSKISPKSLYLAPFPR